MAGKKPDFSAELNEQTDVPPSLDFEVVYGELNLPPGLRDAIAQKSRLYRYTLTGVDIQAELSSDDWLVMLDEIRAIKTAYQWMVGDWLLYGLNREYGNIRTEYEKYAAMLGYSPDTLENIAIVCKAVDFPRRRGKLKFAHHAEVASLPAKEQAKWLELAEIGGWSSKRLRKEITGKPATKKKIKAPDAPPLLDKTNKRRMDRIWRNLSRGTYQDIHDDDFYQVRKWLDDAEKERDEKLKK